jgi:hypothetical protein
MKAVSEIALFHRVRRKLIRSEALVLRKCDERSRSFSELGLYFAVDLYRNVVEQTHIDLEGMARDLKVLGGLEEVRYSTKECELCRNDACSANR